LWVLCAKNCQRLVRYKETDETSGTITLLLCVTITLLLWQPKDLNHKTSKRKYKSINLQKLTIWTVCKAVPMKLFVDTSICHSLVFRLISTDRCYHLLTLTVTFTSFPLILFRYISDKYQRLFLTLHQVIKYIFA
jgi:hypothetical protein